MSPGGRLRSLATRTLRVPTAALVASAGTSLPCQAAAPVYFDIGGAALVVVGIVFLLFVLIGRTKGVIAFVLLTAGLWIWAAIDRALSEHAARTGREVTSERCLREAGSVGARLAPMPDRILVRIDEKLAPGSSAPPWVGLDARRPAEGVEFVQALPSVREAGTAYVDISAMHEEIAGAKGWYLNGIRTLVFNSAGEVAAKQIDYRRGHDRWCLGDAPPASIEGFLRSRLGRPIGLTKLEREPLAPVRVLSPRGSVSVVESGKFFQSERPAQTYVSKQDRMRQRLRLLPQGADCRLREPVDRPYKVVCRSGTPQENILDIEHLSAVHETSSTWLAFSNDTPESFDLIDALRIVERTREGAVLGVWHVRFPALAVDDVPWFEVRNVTLRGRAFTADLVFAGRSESEGAPGQSQIRREWYKHKATVSASLDVE